jgi:hypothetical protein
MRHRLVPLVFLLVSISWSAVIAQDCPALVENALSRAQTSCAIMRGNQACYGYQSLEAQLQDGLSPFAFNGVGDITPVDTIQSLQMSPLNPATDEWGVTLLRVRADISPDQPNQNVTMLAFGAVSIDPDENGEYQPMQAFAFRTGDAASGCTNITENGLIIQTPEGVGRVTLWINDVRVRIGSTVLFQAQPAGDLIISTFEGHAEVQAQGETQEATTGMRVRVPLDAAMHPSAPPTIPEAFDMTMIGLNTLLDVATSFTDGSVRQLIPPVVSNDNSTADGNGNNISNGNGGDENSQHSPPPPQQPPPRQPPSDGGDSDGCNRGHGNGNGNGNCNGHHHGGHGHGDHDH